MGINWKYKVELNDEHAFEKVETTLGVEIPQDLKVLIYEANGASPDKNNIVVGNTERVLGAILSFNEDEHEADDVYTAIKAVNNSSLIPFAIDPFGNYFCLSVKNRSVVFWNHEENQIADTKEDISDFINKLY